MSLLESIRMSVRPSKDYVFDCISVSSEKIDYIYNEALCSTASINQYILYRLLLLKKKELLSLENNIPNCNILVVQQKDILFYLNQGFVILLYNKIYACEVRAHLDRGVSPIQSELSLCGARDSLTENFQLNLGLIRKRIRDSHLKVKDFFIGKYSNTKVGILYIDGIVKMDLVHHIEKNFNKIDIDGIMDSSYLKHSLETSFNIFPTIMMSERPDKCSMALLEGKVVILVDNSPYALILPSLFFDYFHTTDDYYQKSFNTSFIRMIRLFAFLIAIFVPSLYISVTTRNYDIVPLSFLMVLKAGRSFVPFPAYLEAFLMILCFEILKESDLRMSTTSGSAISILGGLILGDAAVAAGIVSPIMIIVIAISSIAGLIFPSIELANAIRTYKLLLLIMSTFFGLYGVFLGLCLLLANHFSTEIFGYSYFGIDRWELQDSFFRVNSKVRYRNSFLTDNVNRGGWK